MRVAVPERGDELINRDILIHRVIARLNIGGPAMHVVLLTREFEGRPVPDVGGAEFAQSDAGSDPGAGGSSDAAAFHARLVAGSVMESEGDMSYFAEERGVEVTRLEEMSREVSLVDDLRSFVELWRLFRRERPDIVHTHTAKAGALGRLAAALAGVPVRIHTYHGHVLGGDYFSPQETAFFRGVEKALSVLTQRLIVLTSAQREEMSARMAVADAEKFAVVPLGLELEPYAVAGIAGGDAEADPGGGTAANDEAEAEKALAETRASARSTLDLDPDDLVVGIVGRLVPIKNHELLFDAVPRLLERLKGAPTLRVLVVGSGEREEALKEHARDLGIDAHVRWLGWRKDLPEIYPAMDVLALPSRDEGTPVAVIEALASGVPVVARDVGGVAEVLEDGKWGRLVEKPGLDPRPEIPTEARSETAAETAAETTAETAAEAPSGSLIRAFADALAETLTDPPSPESRAAARRSVLDRFGLERLVRNLEAIYLEELDRAH